jgi:uncharacterized protein (TIGR02145 family)
MDVCPVGWHLPSDAEWTVLGNAVGGSTVAGEILKSSTAWDGTDDFGFTVLPAGYYEGGPFINLGNNAFFWTATQRNASLAWDRRFSSGDLTLYRASTLKVEGGFSVRCLQD